jgi:hypothetical protein
MKSPRCESSSSPIGVSSDNGSLAILSTLRTFSSGMPSFSTEPGPSIGIVAVFGEYSIVGGKGYVMSIDNGFRWVEVAEPRKSLLSKAIIISDDAPSASTS